MKKTFRFMLAAFAIVVAASCAQELDNPDAIPQEEVELVPMTITVGGETKTTVGDDDKTINWCADDVIAVFDKTGEPREFTIVEGTCNGKTATFEGLVAAGTTDFTAVYPYSAAVSVSNGIVTVNAAETQTLGEANIAEGATLSVASFKKGDAAFDFKTAIGYFKVVVDRADVTSIIVKGTNVAGQATFNASGELQEVTEGKNQVTLTPAEDVFEKGSYYLTLLPGTTAENFSVTLVRQSELATVMTADKAVEIKRNGGFFLESYKLSAKFIINDAATFQKFLSNAHNYTANDTAEIVDDINLEGVELISGSSFKGTLDGGGHSLKNWTSEGVGLFEEISGTIMNLKIDKSCKITPAVNKSFGVFADLLSPGGLIVGSENNADLSVEVESISGSRIAAFVGKNESLIKNCVNNGNIEVRTGARDGVIYMGAFAGHSNPRNSVASGSEITFENVLGFDGCTNNGNVTFYSNGTGGYVHVGGISNSTVEALSVKSAEVKPADIYARCNFRNCTNNGDITVTITNGGSMEDNAGTGGSGNYTNVGGCVGFTHGELRNCDNFGDVTFSVPTNETSQCMSRPSVGGVAGFVWLSMEDCDNEGKVSVKGTFAGGSTDNPGAGNSGNATFAGVVGQIGHFNNNQTCDIKNCHNYGELVFNTWMANNGTAFYHGGVAGFCRAVMTNCSNNAAMTVVSKGAKNHTGGVVGQMVLASSGLHNNGTVNATYLRTHELTKQISDATYVGGVVGYSSQNLTTATNNAAVTVSVPNSYKQSFFGGIIGASSSDRTYTSLTNNATGVLKVTINSCTDGSFYYTGGIVGANSGCTYASCQNFGDIIYEGAAKMRIGGIAAYTNKVATGVVKCNPHADC